MQRWLVIFFIAGLLVAGCSSTSNPTVATSPTALPISVSKLPTSPPAPSPLPSILTQPSQIPSTPNLSFLSSQKPPTPFVVASFADFPGNLADGEMAKNFTAKLLEGEQFSLSEHRGNYILVFPTVVGCGDCIFGINQIKVANEAFQESGLTVLIMNLYIDDDPELWRYFADTIDQKNILWGVVTSASFAVDYNILGLGTIFLIDPANQIVFRSENPLPVWKFEELFDLTTR